MSGSRLLRAALLLILVGGYGPVSWGLSPDNLAHCGGDKQRACCLFEAFPVGCDTGVNIFPATNDNNYGFCPSSSTYADRCVKVSACGGAGQRACCTGNLEGNACLNDTLAPLPGCIPTEGNSYCLCGGSGTGNASQFTCVAEYPTALVGTNSNCGSEGQRACCVIERASPCDSGLVAETDGWNDNYVPISGDRTCSDGITFAYADSFCIKSELADPNKIRNNIAAQIKPIDEPSTNWTEPPPDELRGIMAGYMDMHVHLFAEFAHGGKAFVGYPAPKDANGKFVVDAANNVNTALSPARDLALHKDADHGLGRDTVGDGTNDGARSLFGAPYFSGWPKWTSTTHQQVYYKWLERAWRGGLRAITLLAVTNEAMCKSINKDRVNQWPECENSMGPILDQLHAARDFERFIDEQANETENGVDWFRIVESSTEAREVIRSGKLAVILGIEVDNLFNCKEAGCPADFGLPAERIAPLAQPTTLEEAVQVIYDMGVRHVFPVHNFDNAFGAAAAWQDVIGVGQAVSEGRWWELENCGDGNGDYSFWIDNATQFLVDLLGFGGLEAAPPKYVNGNLETAYASCNARGLRPKGWRLINALMDKGMLIDIDHMSNHSLEETLDLTKSFRGQDEYPLVASHVQFFDRHIKDWNEDNFGRHERMRTRAQLDAIKVGGGMVAAMLKDDVQDTGLRGKKFTIGYTPEVGPHTITDNCRHSSKSWAQAYEYAVDVMGGPVAMGSDFNGIAGHLGPRFGSDACGGWEVVRTPERRRERLAQEQEAKKVDYNGDGFSIPGFGTFGGQVTGFKTFDYNVDGLAHIGLLPDLVADLRAIGLSDHYYEALMCSAEQYVRVWGRAEAIAAGNPVPDEPWLCTVTDDTPPISTASVSPPAFSSGWHGGDVRVTLSATDDSAGIEEIGYTSSGASILAGSHPGTPAELDFSSEGITTLRFYATDLAGNEEQPENELTLRIDRSAPTISGSAHPAANDAGWNNQNVEATFICDDTLSGIASCGPDETVANEGADQSVGGTAEDNAGNVATTQVTGINLDKTPPTVTVTGVTDGAIYTLGAVPAAGCQTTDGLSGVTTAAVIGVSGGTTNNVGAFAADCTGAKDVADNTNQASATFAVHYDFPGLEGPLANRPPNRRDKAGRSLPLVFSLGGFHGLDILAAGSPTSDEVDCGSGTPTDAEEPADSAGGRGLKFDTETGLYSYVWKSSEMWADTCRTLYLRFDDGTTHEVSFSFK